MFWAFIDSKWDIASGKRTNSLDDDIQSFRRLLDMFEIKALVVGRENPLEVNPKISAGNFVQFDKMRGLFQGSVKLQEILGWVIVTIVFIIVI